MSTSLSERVAVGGRPPRAFARRVAAAGLPGASTSTASVTEADLVGLPPAAARYLRAMGVVGRPRDVVVAGALRRPVPPRARPAVDAHGRLAVQLRGRGGPPVPDAVDGCWVVPMWGWDTYRAGRRPDARQGAGLVTVADGSGPEFDTSELVTWLDDAVLLAPGDAARRRGPSWEAGGGRRLPRCRSPTPGAPCTRRCSSTTRTGRGTSVPRTAGPTCPAGSPGRPGARPWTGWTVVDGRPRITGAAAVWHLPEGDFRYGEMTLVDLALDVPPGR